MFEEVEKYCTFIGYPRSGHSLVGSLLDAHPDAVIAHELNALEHVRAGIDRERLFRLLVENSRGFTESGREWEGYAYEVTGQWQGRYRRLRVIGDKKGGASTRVLASEPRLLDRLHETVAVELAFVHVIRNPYDNIGTMFRRRRANRSLRATIKRYFALCDAVALIRAQAGEDAVFDIRHEVVVEDPLSRMGELCEFLGLEPEEGYLRACSGLVYGSPHKSRNEIEWNPAALEMVQEGIERYGFLKGYSFEE